MRSIMLQKYWLRLMVASGSASSNAARSAKARTQTARMSIQKVPDLQAACHSGFVLRAGRGCANAASALGAGLPGRTGFSRAAEKRPVNAQVAVAPNMFQLGFELLGARARTEGQGQIPMVFGLIRHLPHQ